MENMETVKCIDLVDDEPVEIELRKDIGLYYTENNKNYSLRYDFKQSYDNDINNYMLFAYDIVPLDEFSQSDINLMNDTDYEGKFVYKIVTDDGSVFTHYYSFIGMENEKELKLIPIKIPKENKYTIDPRSVLSTSWYYLEIEEKDFIELKDIQNEVERTES